MAWASRWLRSGQVRAWGLGAGASTLSPSQSHLLLLFPFLKLDLPINVTDIAFDLSWGFPLRPPFLSTGIDRL